MPWTPERLLALLDDLGVEHSTIRHPPVFTVEEAGAHTGHLPGGHCKSLFLKDKKGALWLLVCLDHRRIDMNLLSKATGGGRLSFGRPELLEEVMGMTPGSVTPFALVNDPGHRVRVLLDRAMLEHDRLNYHPLTNTATTTIASGDLRRFLEWTGHEVRVLDLDASGIARPEAG
jgi:Ala-tRNA(Pro) deacylase